MLHGIDASHYQGTINWAETRVAFGFIKATQGTSYVDPDHAANVKGARAARIRVGHYHFADGLDAAAEAEYFLVHADPQPGDLLALDFESSGVLGVKYPVWWAAAWLETVQARTGNHPIVYMNTYVLGRFNWEPLVQRGYHLWLACPSAPSAPSAPWPSAAFRQVGTTTVAGISGRVDSDEFDGDAAQLAAVGLQPKPKPTYTVKAGDTLQSIATAHHVTLAALVDANRLIHTGQILDLP